tara:strand:+ start:545 stop:1009 length:465 start_codon:yes stop_codon:yes gene_type:complete
MKAKDYNGLIKTFISLPKSYGNIIGGFDLLSDAELQSYGFYDVVTPEYNLKIQELGPISFDSENNVFTYPVNDKTWSETLAQLKEKQIEEAKISARTFLYNTDWYVIRKAEKGTAIPDDIETQRDNIRTTCDNHEAAINNLTTKAAVMDYNIVY